MNYIEYTKDEKGQIEVVWRLTLQQKMLLRYIIDEGVWQIREKTKQIIREAKEWPEYELFMEMEYRQEEAKQLLKQLDNVSNTTILY